MSNDLVKRLNAETHGDELSHRYADLVAGASSRIEDLEAKLAKAVNGLREAETAPEPDHHVPQFRHVMDVIGATLAQITGETDGNL